jgi:hypothetical protein
MKTDWMRERFTAREKRDCAARLIQAFKRAESKMGKPAAAERDVAILQAIVDDYDFQDRQQEMPLG